LVGDAGNEDEEACDDDADEGIGENIFHGSLSFFFGVTKKTRKKERQTNRQTKNRG
jgi:hypothetical protein